MNVTLKSLLKILNILVNDIENTSLTNENERLIKELEECKKGNEYLKNDFLITFLNKLYYGII